MLRKNEPLILISSQRTTVIFCPLRTCFATMLASRPRRWPLPSMTMGLEEKVDIACSARTGQLDADSGGDGARTGS